MVGFCGGELSFLWLLLLVSHFMSDSVQPHRRQPNRLHRPWDSPGKNTGVGCHFLLQCMKVKSESEVAQSCLTLSDPVDCSLPDSSIHGIFHARVLEWGAIAILVVRSFHIFCIYNFYNQGEKSIFKMSGRHILEKFSLFYLHNGI